MCDQFSQHPVCACMCLCVSEIFTHLWYCLDLQKEKKTTTSHSLGTDPRSPDLGPRVGPQQPDSSGLRLQQLQEAAASFTTLNKCNHNEKGWNASLTYSSDNYTVPKGYWNYSFFQDESYSWDHDIAQHVRRERVNLKDSLCVYH